MKKIIIIFVFFLFMLLILEIFAKILFPEFSSRSVEAYKDHAIIQGKKNFYKKLISRNKSEIYEISIRDKKFNDNNIKQDYYVRQRLLLETPLFHCHVIHQYAYHVA